MRVVEDAVQLAGTSHEVIIVAVATIPVAVVTVPAVVAVAVPVAVVVVWEAATAATTILILFVLTEKVVTKLGVPMQTALVTAPDSRACTKFCSKFIFDAKRLCCKDGPKLLR